MCKNSATRYFFSSRGRHTRCYRDWSSDVCSSDLFQLLLARRADNLERELEYSERSREMALREIGRASCRERVLTAQVCHSMHYHPRDQKRFRDRVYVM